MSLDRLLFRFRNPIAALPIAYALFSTRWEWEDTTLMWSIAIALAMLGVMLRAWATCHCLYASGMKKTLAVTGPYAYVRNPLYVGNILIILGAVVASELEWLLPIAFLWALAVYSAVAAYEGRVMLAKFGDAWVRYRDTTPAWIPSFSRAGQPRSFVQAVVRQAANLVWLAPFILKEMNVLGLGCGR
jgi:protein-S-isoprenylcysteine O-methyltransferase Ste14